MHNDKVFFNKKVYNVLKDAEGNKYVISQKQKVYLSSIRGKYRYVRKSGGGGSWMLDIEGNQNPLGNLTHDVDGTPQPFFRKYFAKDDKIEKIIVKMICKIQKKHPSMCKTLLRIYDITDSYYDAELLDKYEFSQTKNKADDIKRNLDILHGMNIVYVDLKEDNIGYSSIDKVWKIYDFDSSGVMNSDRSSWKVEAPFYMNYKIAYQQHFHIHIDDAFFIKKDRGDIFPLTKIDDITYNLMFR
jgi:serine/threonine protein kinase